MWGFWIFFLMGGDYLGGEVFFGIFVLVWGFGWFFGAFFIGVFFSL